MKIWIGHSSEHSARLVMIGRFTSIEQAATTEDRFRQLSEVAERLPEQSWDPPEARMSEDIRNTLYEMGLYGFTRGDLEIYRYDHTVRRQADRLQLSTDESDVQGFLKLLLEDGAKVEIFSGHYWPDDEVAAQDRPAEADAPEVDTTQ